MNHHDNISSYVDNELSSEQEQEFLISLAANENLRKSFRSELVLKNVLHQDERLTAPPRDLRVGIFAAIGLNDVVMNQMAGTSANQVTTASINSPVATQTSFFKTLFATKVNALLTSVTVGVSALVGFTTHALVTPEQQVPTTTQQVVRTIPSAPVITVPSITESENSNLANAKHRNAPVVKSKAKTAKKSTAASAEQPASLAAEPTASPEQTVGVGEVAIKPHIERK